MKKLVAAWLAGFASTLTFHQGLLFALHRAGVTTRAAWDMTAVAPLGVPSVLSLAFFGGLWGVALWWMIRAQVGARYWAAAVLLGAVLPTLVALFVVFPLKGLAVGAGWDPAIWIGALLLNGAWGFGVALLMRLATKQQR